MRALKLILLSTGIFFIACGTQTAEELWNAADGKSKQQDFDAAVRKLEKLVSKYPDSPLAAKAQFHVGDLLMNKMDRLEDAIVAFGKTNTAFPESEEAVKALFMIGFVNANYLEDLPAAERAYQEFLKQYPNHSLVTSVKFELANLGKSIDEIEALKGIVDAE